MIGPSTAHTFTSVNRVRQSISEDRFDQLSTPSDHTAVPLLVPLLLTPGPKHLRHRHLQLKTFSSDEMDLFSSFFSFQVSPKAATNLTNHALLNRHSNAHKFLISCTPCNRSCKRKHSVETQHFPQPWLQLNELQD